MKDSERASEILDAFIGSSTSRLFRHDFVPHTTEDGKALKKLAYRCAWCFEVVTDNYADPPIDNVADGRSLDKHAEPCRVASLLRKHNAGEQVSAEFNEVVRKIEAADFEKPQ